MDPNKPNDLTEEQQFIVNLGAYYVGHVKKLRRYGMRSFDEQGMVTVVDKKGEESFQNGREFMMEALGFFEGRDESYAYRVCADLKKIIDEYDDELQCCQVRFCFKRKLKNIQLELSVTPMDKL